MNLILIATGLFAAASWAFFAYLLFFVPPTVSGALVISNLAYFLLSGFVALALSATLIFYFFHSTLRQKSKTIDPPDIFTKLYIKSARRGLLLAVLVTGFALLSLTGFFNILNAALLVGTIVLIEVYFSR